MNILLENLNVELLRKQIHYMSEFLTEDNYFQGSPLSGLNCDPNGLEGVLNLLENMLDIAERESDALATAINCTTFVAHNNLDYDETRVCDSCHTNDSIAYNLFVVDGRSYFIGDPDCAAWCKNCCQKCTLINKDEIDD